MAICLLLVIVVSAGPLCNESDDPTVQELIKQLSSERIEERSTAAAGLKRHGLAALPSLKALSTSPDTEVRSQANYLAQWIQLDAALSSRLKARMAGIVDLLVSSPAEQWTQTLLKASEAYGQSPPEKGPLTPGDLEPLLKNAIQGAKADEAKIAVCRVIHTIRPGRIPLDVLGFANDTNPAVRAHAAAVIALVSGKPALAVLLELLRDVDASVRLSALNGLSVRSDRTTIPQVATCIEDATSSVRAQAVKLLAQLDAKQHLVPIVGRLGDEELYVRECARTALLDLGGKKLAPQIIPLLSNDNATLRKGALDALGHLYITEALAEVLPHLKDKEPEVRLHAVRTLVLLDARENSKAITELIGDPDALTRAEAVFALGELGAREAIPRVAQLLNDDDQQVRLSAIRALGRLDARDQFEQLCAALKDVSYAVRNSAVEALARLRIETAVPRLIALLEDNSFEARLSGLPVRVFQALGHFNSKDVISVLKTGLTRESAWERVAAAQSLCLLGDQSGVSELLKMTGTDRQGSFVSLNFLRDPETWKELQTTRIENDCRGTRLDLLKFLARLSGKSLRAEHSVEKQLESKYGVIKLRSCNGINTVAEALPDCLTGDLEIILEAKEIKVIARQEALRFWQQWWERKKED